MRGDKKELEMPDLRSDEVGTEVDLSGWGWWHFLVIYGVVVRSGFIILFS